MGALEEAGDQPDGAALGCVEPRRCRVRVLKKRADAGGCHHVCPVFLRVLEHAESPFPAPGRQSPRNPFCRVDGRIREVLLDAGRADITDDAGQDDQQRDGMYMISAAGP